MVLAMRPGWRRKKLVSAKVPEHSSSSHDTTTLTVVGRRSSNLDISHVDIVSGVTGFNLVFELLQQICHHLLTIQPNEIVEFYKGHLVNNSSIKVKLEVLYTRKMLTSCFQVKYLLDEVNN